METPFLFVFQRELLTRVDFNEIQVVESRRNYCRIKTARGTYTVQKRLIQLQQLLPADQFCRIHRGYIIRFDQLNYIAPRYLMVGDNQVPIGDKYRRHFRGRLKILT